MKELMTLMMGFVILSGSSSVYASGAGHSTDADERELETATFAGGCYWCMEPPFDELDGVISTTVGYTGGQEKNPTYKEVSSGTTGHAEAIQIVYDPSKISYDKLLDVFWRNIDPTQIDGQFVDIGRQYRTAIFYHNDQQKGLALASKAALEGSGRYDKKLVTEIVPAGEFYSAEDYHQDYYRKNPIRYKFYRHRSGRDQFLKKTWRENDSGGES